MGSDDTARRRDIRQAAADWVVRLSSESCAPTDREAFERWLAADPEHEVAYLRTEAASDTLDRLRALRPPGKADPDLLARPEALRWSALPDTPLATRRPAVNMSRRAVAGLGFGLLVGGGAYLAMGRGSKAYATAVGQQMSIPLGDSGRVQLNTDSKVELSQANPPRHARLVHGEALFSLGKERADPFTVRIDDHQLETAAATFDLRRDAGRIRVLVTEGQVRLRGRAGESSERYDLSLPAGSFAHIGPKGPTVQRQSLDDLTRSLSWRFGAISLAGEPLSEAIDEFNRYNAAKMAVGDAALADLRIGGYFQANDPMGFARAVELTFGVSAIDRGGVLYFVAKPSAG